MKFVNFRNQIAIPSSTPPERGVVSDFLISKCGLTEEEVTKCFRHYKPLLSVKSTQNMEETLELLHCCGLTTSAQFRSVVLYNPMILCLRCDSLKPKFSFLRTVIKEEDISKIVVRDARILNVSEDKLKSRASLFLRSGFDGKTLAHLLARRPRLLMISEEKIMWVFKQAENLGFKKGSKSFSAALYAISGLGRETLERKLQSWSGLGFSEKQISKLVRLQPQLLKLSEEKLKRNADFMVNSMGFSLDDLVKYPALFLFSLEKRIIPRYKVVNALKSMQVQEFKREIYLPTIFYCTEKVFLDKYVNNHPESSILLDIYHGGKVGDMQ